MNLGISDLIKFEFNKFTPVERPNILTNKIPNPNWVAGFTTGEGNFDIRILKSKTHKIGNKIQLRFRISQHERDIKLMELLIKYLETGKIEINHKDSVVSLTIYKFSDLFNKIIPFFSNNILFGNKQYQLRWDWCKVAKIMNEGSHLTIEGLELIRSIKLKMNSRRKY